jgi:hypothetical protein
MVLHRPVELAAVTGKVGNGTDSENPTKYVSQGVDSTRREQAVLWVQKTSVCGRQFNLRKSPASSSSSSWSSSLFLVTGQVN